MTFLLLFLIGYAALLAALFVWLVRGTPVPGPVRRPRHDPVPKRMRLPDHGSAIGWMVHDPLAPAHPSKRGGTTD